MGLLYGNFYGVFYSFVNCPDAVNLGSYGNLVGHAGGKVLGRGETQGRSREVVTEAAIDWVCTLHLPARYTAMP